MADILMRRFNARYTAESGHNRVKAKESSFDPKRTPLSVMEKM